MRRLLPALALLGAVLGAGCGGGGGGGESPPALTTITVTPQTAGLPLGTTVQLSAQGTYSDSSTANLTASVTWQSLNTAVATVSAGGLVSTAGGASVGQSAVVRATSGTISGQTTVTLQPPVLASITLTPQSARLAPSASVQLAAQGNYSDGSTVDLTATATWGSSDNAVATVSSAGLVTAAAGGAGGQTAVITATGDSTQGSADIVLFQTFTLGSLTDPLVAQQWHLQNTGQNGYADTAGIARMDINVAAAYSTYGYAGSGVIAAVLDTGLEIAHEDLAANVVIDGSWNFQNGTTNPTNTVDTDGDHGTSVAGLIAMAPNGIGGIGVAPHARLKGFNVLKSLTDADFLAALGGSTAAPNSADVAIFNQSYGIDTTNDLAVDPAHEAQLSAGVDQLRGGKGALYVKAAGNGFLSYTDSFGFLAACGDANSAGLSCQNANHDPESVLPYQIVVGATDASGVRASYSTAGAAIWVSAPGGEGGFNAAVAPGYGAADYQPAMISADQSSCATGYATTNPAVAVYSSFDQGTAPNTACNYTSTMGGTSAATPVVTGVIALVLEANPALTWRDVKHILASSARQIDASRPAVSVALTGGAYIAEPAWTLNAASRWFHNWYGFGMVDASAAVTAASTYTLGSLGTFVDTGWISSSALSLLVADNNVSGASHTLAVPATPVTTVEAVQIRVSATHSYTGDLGIELTSPSGTRSVLKNIRDGFLGPNLTGMVLLSNAFYGETAAGNWTLKVVDGNAADQGTLTGWAIRIYGH